MAKSQDHISFNWGYARKTARLYIRLNKRQDQQVLATKADLPLPSFSTKHARTAFGAELVPSDISYVARELGSIRGGVEVCTVLKSTRSWDWSWRSRQGKAKKVQLRADLNYVGQCRLFASLVGSQHKSQAYKLKKILDPISPRPTVTRRVNIIIKLTSGHKEQAKQSASLRKAGRNWKKAGGSDIAGSQCTAACAARKRSDNEGTYSAGADDMARPSQVSIWRLWTATTHS